MVVHESIPGVPPGFTQSGSAPPSQQLILRIALTQSNITGLQAETLAISDPSNAQYGQWFSVDDALAFAAPTSATSSAVSAWLSSAGIAHTSISPANDLLQITVSVSQANSLLSAQFASYTHTASGTTIFRTLSYSVPSSVQAHVQFVHPTVSFVPPLQGPLPVQAVGVSPASGGGGGGAQAECPGDMTPPCLQEIYGFPTTLATHSTQNIIGVSGYDAEYANFADVELFISGWYPTRPKSNFTLVEIDAGEDDQTPANAGIEADLDMEMVGLAGGVPSMFISVGDEYHDGIDGFIDITYSILAMPPQKRPHRAQHELWIQRTRSLGAARNASSIFPGALRKILTGHSGLCNAYLILGAVGISVVFASGDGGVSGIQPTECSTFVPSAPGNCPFVTAVGGSGGLPPQVAASLSAGGFSNYFPAPLWQLADVGSYVQSLGREYTGLYNRNGRGIPDVAMQALNVNFAWEGSYWILNGTSCSTPIFAAMIALVNDRLIAARRPVLGFLNPLLYSPRGRAAFTDVTSGTNPGCGTNGFSASRGWDPVTGLGTPNFERLLAAVGLPPS
ncbi:Serine protease S53 [Mycena sanguinolenta]|uniref:Serine protease S53 n=1 Tax=Mycena sanguinolenta TaxID=230812 RepID=A0A8H6Y3V1_9AGAR|nr:Serine protease S53 [Mycena sanguinolenta]